ncbi:hypothetical protein XENORESO_017810 [Xenotaenia resolanae]|uniref:Uncharacterized protein n=1 Tax=Xenotaenia resolanae TaxID=208358 RepID=A0ABV0WMR8_9TELE
MPSSSVTASSQVPPLILACRQTHTHTYIMKGYKDQIVKLKKRKIYKIKLYSIIPTVTSILLNWVADNTSSQFHIHPVSPIDGCPSHCEKLSTNHEIIIILL